MLVFVVVGVSKWCSNPIGAPHHRALGTPQVHPGHRSEPGGPGMAIKFTDEVQKRCPFRGSIPRPLHMRMRNKGERRQGAASLTHLGVGYGDAEIKVYGRHDAALELELAKLSQWGSVRQGSILGSCACAAGSRSTKNPRRFPPCISIFPRHKSIAGGRAQHRGRFSTHLDRANLMEADHELLDCSRHLFTFPAELTLRTKV